MTAPSTAPQIAHQAVSGVASRTGCARRQAGSGQRAATLARGVLPALGGLAFAFALTVVLAAPPAALAAPLEVITLKARVQSQNGPTSGDFAIGATVPAHLGEQIKISLVGTGIVNGSGQEVPVNARFTVAAGGKNLSLVRTGPNWALVSVNAAGGNGLGQISYTTSDQYKMKPGLASGRITIQAGSQNPGPAAEKNDQDSDRYNGVPVAVLRADRQSGAARR